MSIQKFSVEVEEATKRLKRKATPIHLGVVDDLTAGLKWLDNQNATIEKQLSPIYNDFTSLRNKVNKIKDLSMTAIKGVQQGEANINRIITQLKDLGIAANKVPVIKDFETAVKKAEDNMNKVKSIPDIPKI